MPTINDGFLLVDVDGATREQLEAGLIAARASLAASDVTRDEAFEGYFEFEGVMFGNGKALSDIGRRGNQALIAAGEAAGRAMGLPSHTVHLSIPHVFFESERSIDERGIRHLNPDRGPHYELAPIDDDIPW